MQLQQLITSVQLNNLRCERHVPVHWPHLLPKTGCVVPRAKLEKMRWRRLGWLLLQFIQFLIAEVVVFCDAAKACKPPETRCESPVADASLAKSQSFAAIGGQKASAADGTEMTGDLRALLSGLWLPFCVRRSLVNGASPILDKQAADFIS